MASALTLVALPLVFNENRKQDRDLAVAVVAPDAGLAAQLDPTSSEPTGARPVSVSPIAVVSTVAVAVAAPSPTAVPAAVVPAAPVAVASASDALAGPEGDATWDRWAPAAVGTNAPCATPLWAVGVQLTVTNLDNGRSVTCLVIAQVALPSGVVVKLDAALFQTLADLGESPIPVRLSR